MESRTLFVAAIFGGLLFLGGKKAVDLSKASANEKKYAPVIEAAEKKYGIPAGLLHRLIKQESHFRTDIITGAKVSPVGALGIAQFMPATAKEQGVNPLDPVASIDAAGRYLAKLNTSLKSWPKAVGAYNWGIGRVTKAARDYGDNWLARAPAETQNYVKDVMA